MKIPISHLDLFLDETRAFAFLATIMQDGTPQVTPVWFNMDGEIILVNSAQGRVKDRNMRARPYVAMAIIDPRDPYRYVQLRGRVVEATTLGGWEHIHALAKKHLGIDKFTPQSPDEIRVIYRIVPEKITAH
jgi:PPOX class probable F420-dependent enzyme